MAEGDTDNGSEDDDNDERTATADTGDDITDDDIVYQALEDEDEGEETADSDAQSDAGSDYSAYECANLPVSASSSSGRAFSPRLTWLRLVVTAVTCVCGVVALYGRARQTEKTPPPTPASSQPWKFYHNENHVYGDIRSPRENTSNVKYLGDFDSYQDCWAACNQTAGGCPSWTWIR
jgi:hypothetical protein